MNIRTKRHGLTLTLSSDGKAIAISAPDTLMADEQKRWLDGFETAVRLLAETPVLYRA